MDFCLLLWAGSQYSSGMLDGCQKLLDHAKQSATNTLKTHSITAIQRQYK